MHFGHRYFATGKCFPIRGLSNLLYRMALLCAAACGSRLIRYRLLLVASIVLYEDDISCVTTTSLPSSLARAHALPLSVCTLSRQGTTFLRQSILVNHATLLPRRISLRLRHIACKPDFLKMQLVMFRNVFK
jgi:hypothetical protein